jgi:hypothetical protein
MRQGVNQAFFLAIVLLGSLPRVARAFDFAVGATATLGVFGQPPRTFTWEGSEAKVFAAASSTSYFGLVVEGEDMLLGQTVRLFVLPARHEMKGVLQLTPNASYEELVVEREFWTLGGQVQWPVFDADSWWGIGVSFWRTTRVRLRISNDPTVFSAQKNDLTTFVSGHLSLGRRIALADRWTLQPELRLGVFVNADPIITASEFSVALVREFESTPKNPASDAQ